MAISKDILEDEGDVFPLESFPSVEDLSLPSDQPEVEPIIYMHSHYYCIAPNSQINWIYQALKIHYSR